MFPFSMMLPAVWLLHRRRHHRDSLSTADGGVLVLFVVEVSIRNGTGEV